MKTFSNSTRSIVTEKLNHLSECGISDTYILHYILNDYLPSNTANEIIDSCLTEFLPDEDM
jgi:hypothetical protein